MKTRLANLYDISSLKVMVAALLLARMKNADSNPRLDPILKKNPGHDILLWQQRAYKYSTAGLLSAAYACISILISENSSTQVQKHLNLI